MDCGATFCKYMMFLFNFLIFAGGVALLGVSCWVLVDGKSFMDMVSIDNKAVMDGVYVILVVSIFLLVTGFLGCCGAIKENKCLLGIFLTIILVVTIVEIVGVVLAYVYYPKLKEVTLNTMNLYDKNNSTESNTVTAAWDAIQDMFDCCGFDSPADWSNSTGGTVTATQACSKVENPPDNLPGCRSSLEKYLLIIGGVALGVLFVEVLAMVFAGCLIKRIGDDGEMA